jgi:hypothetical protein
MGDVEPEFSGAVYRQPHVQRAARIAERELTHVRHRIQLQIDTWTGVKTDVADSVVPRWGSRIWLTDFTAAGQTERPDDRALELGIFPKTARRAVALDRERCKEILRCTAHKCLR